MVPGFDHRPLSVLQSYSPTNTEWILGGLTLLLFEQLGYLSLELVIGTFL